MKFVYAELFKDGNLAAPPLFCALCKEQNLSTKQVNNGRNPESGSVHVKGVSGNATCTARKIILVGNQDNA